MINLLFGLLIVFLFVSAVRGFDCFEKANWENIEEMWKKKDAEDWKKEKIEYERQWRDWRGRDKRDKRDFH